MIMSRTLIFKLTYCKLEPKNPNLQTSFLKSKIKRISVYLERGWYGYFIVDKRIFNFSAHNRALSNLCNVTNQKLSGM